MNNLQLNLGERIKDVEGFEGRFLISDFGRLFSINGRWKGLKELKPGIGKKEGYYITSLRMKPKRETIRIHQLVGNHFVDNPDNKPQLNHKDGNKLNNHYLNLEWCTIAENIEHAVRTGLIDMKGEKHFHAKLKDPDIKSIFQMRLNGFRMSDIGNRFGVSRRTIGDVLNRKLWTHVNIGQYLIDNIPRAIEYNGENHHQTLLTNKNVYEIHNLRKEGLTPKEISIKYDVSRHIIYDILNGTTWAKIHSSVSTGSGS